MKLISTLNSIIIILIPNKDVQEQLEVVHKALTIGTTFWTNLKQFPFFFFFHLTICVQTLCMICDSFALSYECWKTHFNVDIWMWCVNIFLRCSLSLFRVWNHLKQFAKLVIFWIWDYCQTSPTITIVHYNKTWFLCFLCDSILVKNIPWTRWS